MRIIELEKVDSTNEYCKREDKGEDLIVIAESQLNGKGTKGRSFSSDNGGLYISVMRHYEKFPAEDAFSVMVNTSVAVCKTLEEFGIFPQIKWANDVMVDGKKICGTLIENTFCGDKLIRSIVGCGINVNNNLSENLKDVAVSMRDVLGKDLSVKFVKETFIKNINKKFSLSEYKKYMGWLGNTVILRTKEGEKQVIAIDIAADGRLIIEDKGEKRLISSAEVSLRI